MQGLLTSCAACGHASYRDVHTRKSFRHGVGTSQQLRPRQLRISIPVHSSIRAIEGYDSSFELDQQAQATLETFLSSEDFAAKLVRMCALPSGTQVDFTGLLFKPLPWSPTTRKGMPEALERYHDDPNYTIINVPPEIMFKCKIFKPSRLCAIFRNTWPANAAQQRTAAELEHGIDF